jgi:hypothetical protein
VVHHGGDPAEQRLLVDLADGEAVTGVIDRGLFSADFGPGLRLCDMTRVLRQAPL